MGASRERKEAEESVAKIEKKEKKDKKDKKEKKEKKDKKRSETDGVHKNKEKSDKKDKKQKKEKLAQALDAHLQASAAESAAVEEKKAEDVSADSSDNEMADAAAAPAADAKKAKGEAKPIVRGAIVDFAIPMAADKYQKKVFKIVKRAAKQQALLRGVKEVNKALRKAPPKNPSAASANNVPGVVVIAGDVNPAEVIMHLPLACEDVNAPYVFVASRGELGQAARTKRPTSVVMIKAEGRATKKASGDKAAKAESDDEDEGSYAELYQEFVKLTQKEYAKQMKGII